MMMNKNLGGNLSQFTKQENIIHWRNIKILNDIKKNKKKLKTVRNFRQNRQVIIVAD